MVELSSGGGPLVLRAGWVVPVDSQFRLIRDGEVVIDSERIVSVGPRGHRELPGARVMEFPNHAILPGLVNVHSHVAGCLFRGLTEDRADGFYGMALPMEGHLSAEAIHKLSRLGIAEVLLAGCTVINEIYHGAEETAASRCRARRPRHIAHKVFDTDLASIRTGERTQIPQEGERRLQENIDLFDRWQGAGDGRVQVRFGAHAADTCSPRLLASVRDEARSRQAGRHIHVAQSPEERDYMLAAHGTGSIEFLAREGFLGPDVVVAHVVYATPKGVEILRDTDTPVAHCPAIVAKRGRFAPVKAIYEAGVRVGWGTDWVTMDPWDAMRFGISGARLAYGEIDLLSAREALWRSTMGSANVLGEQDRLGSLEPGKLADLILVDLDQAHLAPLHDPVAVMVYNATGHDVTHVMVGGRFLVEDRHLNTCDLPIVIREAQLAAERIWEAAALAPPGDGITSRWPLAGNHSLEGATRG